MPACWRQRVMRHFVPWRNARAPRHHFCSLKSEKAGNNQVVDKDDIGHEASISDRTTVPPAGIEPAHMASEANALSAELRGRRINPTGPFQFFPGRRVMSWL